MFLNVVSIEVVGFEGLRDEYATYPDFSEIYQALSQGPSSDHSDYTLLDGYMFKIGRASCRERVCLYV